jgi:hypothetical protein
MGVLMRVPPEDLTKPLDLPEACWCIMETIRNDVLYSFSADDGKAAARYEIREGTRLLCYDRPAPSMELAAEIWTKLYGLGVKIVREAVNEAKAENPELARRGGPPLGIPERGKPGRAAVREAQGILNVLGFRPGPEDGSAGRRTIEALEAFQHVMGIQVTGELDGRTMHLLRNCVFSPSDRPVVYAEYDPKDGRISEPKKF